MKHCIACGEDKSEDQFPLHYDTCKRCKCDYNKRYYAENRERLKAEVKRYREENPDVIKDYRKRNKAKLVANAIAWNKANPDKVKIIEKRRNAKPERKSENIKRLKLWLKNNPERALLARQECTKRYYEQNPHKVIATNARRRAAKLNATMKWGQAGIEEIYEEAREEGMHVDHIVPLRGELVSGLHVRHNLQLLTASQNASKGNRCSHLN